MISETARREQVSATLVQGARERSLRYGTIERSEHNVGRAANGEVMQTVPTTPLDRPPVDAPAAAPAIDQVNAGWTDTTMLPLLIGATGHRDLRPEDVPLLTKQVKGVFDQLRRLYPHTPLVLV